MKHLILFFVLLVFFHSCKKDSDKPKQPLLNEVKSNGVVTVKIQYDGLRPVRYESFAGGVSNAYLKFEYDVNGHIAQLSSFSMPGDVPAVRIIFETDATGKVTGISNYDLTGGSPNTPVASSTYTYNAGGQITKVEHRDGDDEFLSLTNCLYFPDGNLKEVQNFKEASGILWMSGKTAYSIPNGVYPQGADALRNILGPDFLANLFSETIHSFTYDQNGAITTQRNRVMSAREFNGDGSLKKQDETYTSIKPAQAAVVSHVEYGYLIQ